MALDRAGNLERETMPMIQDGREEGQQMDTGTIRESGPTVTVAQADKLPDPASRRFIVDHFVSLFSGQKTLVILLLSTIPTCSLIPIDEKVCTIAMRTLDTRVLTLGLSAALNGCEAQSLAGCLDQLS
jgi:hypothetical protein